MITYQEVRQRFEYHDDGHLIWKTHSRKHYIGRVAGHDSRTGKNKVYRYVAVRGRQYRVHRLIFLWHHGYFPVQVDHIDGDKLNNRIENLRPVTNAENQWNRGDTKGYFYDQNRRSPRKWRVTLRTNGKRTYHGCYETEEEAAKVAAKLLAAREAMISGSIENQRAA